MFFSKAKKQIRFKLGKDVKVVYCHFAYLTYIQSTSCKMSGWMKLKLESRLLGEISITSDVQMIDTTLIRLVKAMVFPVVMYGCESWTVKKAECKELMLLSCGVGEDS